MNQSTVCARCGAKLVWDGPTGADSFQPPRAGRGRALARRIFFWRTRLPQLDRVAHLGRELPSTTGRMARVVPNAQTLSQIPAGLLRCWRNISRERLIIIACSLLLPGLGHLVEGTYRQGLKLFSFWLLSLLTIIFLANFMPYIFYLFYYPLLALVMAIHCLAVVYTARPEEYCRTRLGAWTASFFLGGLISFLYVLVWFVFVSDMTVAVTRWVAIN